MSKLTNFWRKLGPGIVTGASDDDPSGIAIYSQVGAQTGFTLLWTALLTFPLMAAIQETCARIGLASGHGLAGNLKRHYPTWIIYPIIFLAVAANTLNIGADLAAMGEVSHLLLPALPAQLFVVIFAALIVLLLIYTSYKTIANILKWFALALLAYVVVPFFTSTDWWAAVYHTITPNLALTKQNLLLIVAIFGTTISPYLFFWQTSMEVEDKLTKAKRFFTKWLVTKHELRDMKEDVTIGMFLSNAVMWFIIVAAAVTLHASGITQISSAKDAAEALRPFVGNAAYLIFSLGIISIGLLAIPVLAGANSYALAETFGWKEGLNKKFYQAKQFYIVLIVSTLIGMLIPVFGINPITVLFYTGVFFGITAPPLIFVILHIANNRQVMGRYVNSPITNFLGYFAFAIMTLAVVLMFIL